MDEVAEGIDPNVLRLEIAILWNNKAWAGLRAAASQGFSQVARPLEALLTILEGCAAYKKPADLKQRVLLEFQQWLKDHPQVNLASLPEEQALPLRQRALELVTERLPGVANPIIDIYQLRLMEPAALTQHVARLKGLSLHCEAAAFSVKMGLQLALDMEDMCIPLLLQDKVTLAESFVYGHPHLELRLVTLLDSWCDPRTTQDFLSGMYPDLVLSQFHINQLTSKVLSKHVFRLIGKFNIDPALCHHSVHMRKKGTLRFLMEKRFKWKDIDQENWCDHTKAIIADDPEMQIYLDALLTNYTSSKHAAHLSKIVRGGPNAQKSCLNATTQEWAVPKHHSDRYYQLPISRDNIHFLGTVEDLQQCRELVFKEGGTVGVDMEWRAGFGCVVPQRVALIQLAVLDQVFIVDMCSADLWQHPSTLDFMKSFLCDTKVRKLGYDLGGDLKYLQTTWSLPEPLKMARVLDLHSVHQEIKRLKVKRTAEKGLSQLVQHVLGKPLDKREQLSYWERRPLHPSQIRYAATDAFCLLEVFSAVGSEPSRYGLTPEKLAV
ncbi:unnamed protein product [Gadus morhua 'NCC']